jgi:endonuclease YncB( thermonuclease family)
MMTQKKLTAFIFFFFLNVLVFYLPKPLSANPGKAIEGVKVLQVVDGDTIVLENGEKVRYLGIDTPETGQPLSLEATQANNRLVGGKIVSLELGKPERDKDNRLLAYVFVDNVLINAELVRLGYSPIKGPVDQKYKKLFFDYQEEAFRRGSGLWSERAKNPAIKIFLVNADARGDDRNNLNDEYIILTNDGLDPVDLTGWIMSDAVNHTYHFPSFVLSPNGTVTIRTGIGKNTKDQLYWGSRSPIWNNNGDTIFLMDAEGNIVLAHTY